MKNSVLQSASHTMTWHDIKTKLDEGHTIDMIPKGNSMFPLIRKQDHVLLKSQEMPLRTNRIYLFERSDHTLVIHRLCQIKKQDYFFCGDNQTTLEGPVSASQIQAEAYAVYHEHSSHQIDLTSPFPRIAGRIWIWLLPCRGWIARHTHFITNKLKRKE